MSRDPEIPEIVDTSYLEGLFPDAGERTQILRQYADANRSDLDRLQAAADGGDFTAVRSIAHQLKGAAGLVGAGRMVEASQTLEQAAGAGNVTDVLPAVARVMDEAVRIEAWLDAGDRPPRAPSAPTGPGASDSLDALIVGQPRLFVDLCAQVLIQSSMKARGTTSADEARRIRGCSDPGLLLVDPEMDGVAAFLDEIPAGPERPRVVGLVDSDHSRTRARDLGMDQVVDKASGLESFADALRNLVDVDLSDGDSTKPRILVVEDSDGQRNTMMEILRKMGYAVAGARNGADAVDLVARDDSVRVVLMDLNMPVMGGLEALRHVTARANHPKVIMLTSVEDREVAQLALERGASDYLVKTTDLATLRSSIELCLARMESGNLSWWKRFFG